MLRAIDHVGIAVPNITSASQLFIELLECTREDPVDLPQQQVRVQFLNTPNGKIELLSPLGDSGPLQRFLNRRGPGLHHICIEVDNIHQKVAELLERGVRMVDKEPWKSPHGWTAFIHPSALGGISVELREKYG